MKTIKLLIFITISFYSCQRSNSNDNNKFKKIPQKDVITENHLENKNEFKDGDLIFLETNNGQSHAIKFLTNSKYSHVGVITKTEKGLFVYEASNKVRFTPINTFIKSGSNQHFVVKRLKKAEKVLTEEILQKMKEIGQKYYKKNYDLCFEWTDDNIYCSELVWKIYKEALDIEIGTPQTLKDYDLSYGPAQKIIKKRMVKNGCSFSDKEIIISPADMFESKLLKTIEIDQ